MAAVSFTIKGGQVIEYENDFEFTEENLRKFNCIRDGDSEGPWMWIHPDDKKDYDNDIFNNDVRLGVAANQCINGIPWGGIFPYKLKGSGRPICDMDELVDFNGNVVLSKKLFMNSANQILEDDVLVTKRSLGIHSYAIGEDDPLTLKLKEKYESQDNPDE